MATVIKDLGLVGKKLGMTQLFDDEGNIVPVTAIELADNIVTDIKTQERDGYNAIQVGNFPAKDKHMTKPMKVALEKRNAPLMRKLQEFRLNEVAEGMNIGDAINAEEFFQDLTKVDLTGMSIGKGFQGGVKLHNMSVGRNSHGSKSKRQIGSIGPGTTPGNVKKGKRMPSMMGNRTVTTTKVKVFKYIPEKKIVLVKGPVPGKAGTFITIKANGIKSWNHDNKN
jgi:large subunit ribosomal protein L3